jgi:hypothetical protein
VSDDDADAVSGQDESLGHPGVAGSDPVQSRARAKHGSEVAAGGDAETRSARGGSGSTGMRGTSTSRRGSVRTPPTSGAAGNAPTSTRAGSAPAGGATSGAGTLTVFPQSTAAEDPTTSDGARSPDPASLDPSPPETARPAAPGATEPTDPLSPNGPVSAPRVSMLTSAAYVTVGEQVSILVRIDFAHDVAHAPFHVVFNSEVLRFVAGDEGTFLSNDGRPTAFFAAPTSEGSRVVVGLSRLGSVPGVGGSGDLCVLRFDVIGPGNAALSFLRARVLDSMGRALDADFEPAALTAS